MTPRWYPLRYHATQYRLVNCGKRFRVCAAGRRSGKTERAKRFVVTQALQFTEAPDGLFVCAAPTHAQAKRIYWKDIKRLVPPRLLRARPRESELSIELFNGATIMVVGMDAPERIEGVPLDGIVLDEYASMKEEVWGENIRPALSTPGRPGWAWMIGVPEGRNHFFRQSMRAQEDDSGSWEYCHWKSEEILDPEEIESAKHDLDPLTYEQEYEASFLNFQGRAYYPFRRDVHAGERLPYLERHPLIFCLDFNVEPGTATVAQEQRYSGSRGILAQGQEFTAFIGEVWIPRNSTTSAVCRKLIAEWSKHEGDIFVYGDATGGARKSSSDRGSDWDIVEAELRPAFGSRLHIRRNRDNPPERARVNAVNSRLESVDGTIRLLVDPARCPRTVEDFEGVTLLEGGSGEIDKKRDKLLTHLTDGLGYYIEERFPVRGPHRFSAEEV